MESDLERRLSDVPRTDEERAALRGLLRMRSEGKSLDEIAAGLRAEVGLELSPAAVDRVLGRIAGPVPSKEGGDPEYFSGYLGGG